jgi:hypothetical protein
MLHMFTAVFCIEILTILFVSEKIMLHMFTAVFCIEILTILFVTM